MNTNLFRTILTWLAILIPGASVLLGCAPDAITGVVSCATSWLPPQYAVMASTAFLILNQIIKALDGTTLTKPVDK